MNKRALLLTEVEWKDNCCRAVRAKATQIDDVIDPPEIGPSWITAGFLGDS